MPPEENENPLAGEPFSYRLYKNGNVSIAWNEKEVTLLKGARAERFLAQIAGKDEAEKQMAMAGITGNFKRGNEREGKLRGKT
jgi:hypothetical protein